MHLKSMTRIASALLLVSATAANGRFLAPPADSDADPDAAAIAEHRAQRGKPFGLTYTSFSGSGEYVFDASFKGAPGDVSVVRLGGGVEVGLPAGERGMIALGLSQEYSKYDVSGGAFGLPDSAKFKPHFQTLDLRYSRSFDEQWSMTYLADLTLAGEWDASAGDKITYGSGLLFSYRVSDELTLGAGARVQSRIEDSLRFIPIAFVRWQIAERWSLSSLRRGAALNYAIDEEQHWVADLAVTYDSRRFRLDDSHPGRLRDGVIEDERVPVVLGLTYKPNPGLTVRVYGGAAVWQKLTAETKSGRTIEDLEADPAGMLGAMLTLSF